MNELSARYIQGYARPYGNENSSVLTMNGKEHRRLL